MSANNQTLLVEKDKKWYVFSNITAESWEDESEIRLSPYGNDGIYDDFETAYKHAELIEAEDCTEYGIYCNALAKDGTPVKLI